MTEPARGVKTTADGVSDSALVFEQRVQDLCHDELFERGAGTERSTSRLACASRVGSSPHTRSPRTDRTSQY